jgi:hypothetical protein
MSQVDVVIPAGVALPFETDDIYVDEDERVYYKGAIHVECNGSSIVSLLNSGQVEILCKLIKVVRKGK